jgi:tryptophan-rich hypothetical protein
MFEVDTLLLKVWHGSTVAISQKLLFREISMNNINPTKLLNSKWTAVQPSNKEKHFLVTEVEFDEEGVVVSCTIEAVMSKRLIPINWLDLKNDMHWLQGWK